MTMQKTGQIRGFTGWHMTAIMIGFFGTIITANGLMAYHAGSSWSGMLSKNTYVASQDFNIKAAEAREWARQGLRGDVEVGRSSIRYRLDGPGDVLSGVNIVVAIFHRPVGDKQDFALTLRRDADGSYIAEHALDAGPWIVDLAARSGDRTVFHQAERIVVGEGEQ
jgi:nitrogen fixation protein FixH